MLSLNTYKYEEENLFLDKYTIFEETRTWEMFNWLQCYDFQSLEKEFLENGFRITGHYSNVAGDTYESGSPEIAIAAKKIA